MEAGKVSTGSCMCVCVCVCVCVVCDVCDAKKQNDT